MLRRIFFFGVLFYGVVWLYLYFSQPIYSYVSRQPKYYTGFTYKECVEFPGSYKLCNKMFENKTNLIITFHDCYSLGYDEKLCYLLSYRKEEL